MAHDFPLAVVIHAVDKASKPLAALAGRMNAFARHTTELGHSLTFGITAPVAALFTLAAHQALHAEEALFRLQDAAGGATEELEHAVKAAGELGGGLFDPADTADALAAMVKLGTTLDQALASVASTTDLAIASSTGLAESTGLTLKIIRAYGLELSDVAHVTDVLAKANAGTDIGLAGLADNLISLSPLAHSAGLQLADVAATVVALSKVNANPVAVLRASMAALLNPTKKVAESLAKLKIRREDIFRSNGALRSMADIVQVLEQHGAKAGDLLAIFGKRAGPGMTALLAQGSEAMRKNAAGFDQVGFAHERAAVRAESAEGSMRRLKVSLQELGTTIGNSGIIQYLNDVTKGLVKLVHEANAADPRIVKVFVAIAAGAAVLGPVIWTIGKMITALSAFAAAWGWLVEAVGVAAVALALPAEAIAALILAIPVAVGALIYFRHEIGKFFGDLADTLKGWADSIANTKAWKAFEWIISAGQLGLEGPAAGTGALGAAGGKALAGAAPVGSADVRVSFENAPPGMRAVVAGQHGIDLGLDVGYSMAGD
jgi:TP901 family phage tail tape measure protein